MPPQQRRTIDGPSLGEIGRLLEALRDETRAFRVEVNGRFDEIAGTYLRVDVYRAERSASAEYVKGIESRLEKLEGNQAWLVRIIIGTVIAAVLGGLFAASKVIGA
jgi:hypothetical protein